MRSTTCSARSSSASSSTSCSSSLSRPRCAPRRAPAARPPRPASGRKRAAATRRARRARRARRTPGRVPRRAAAEDPLNVLAIDQGTSATKAVLVGPGQQVLGRGEVPVRVRAVGPDGVEADPEELYASVIAAGSRALAEAGTTADAVALANQGETVLAWDRRTGRPLTPAIVWQDRRSAGICQRLAGSADRLADVTGLHLDPYFAAPKMTWLAEKLDPGGVITTTDTWLLARLGAD